MVLTGARFPRPGALLCVGSCCAPLGRLRSVVGPNPGTQGGHVLGISAPEDRPVGGVVSREAPRVAALIAHPVRVTGLVRSEVAMAVGAVRLGQGCPRSVAPAAVGSSMVRSPPTVLVRAGAGSACTHDAALFALRRAWADLRASLAI